MGASPWYAASASGEERDILKGGHADTTEDEPPYASDHSHNYSSLFSHERSAFDYESSALLHGRSFIDCTSAGRLPDALQCLPCKHQSGSEHHKSPPWRHAWRITKIVWKE